MIEQRPVTEDEADIRLDRWFRRHFPSITQGAIQKLCRTGQIRVDGKRAEAATRLAPGQAVRVPPMPDAPAPKPAPNLADPILVRELEDMVVYRDDQILVLNKPHGLAVQGGPGILRHLDGMLDGLRLGSEHRPRLVHRLDRDTSGVLVLARTPGTAAKLAAAFRGRDVRKTYWAVVAGRPVPVEGRIDLPLLRYAGLRGERSVPPRGTTRTPSAPSPTTRPSTTPASAWPGWNCRRSPGALTSCACTASRSARRSSATRSITSRTRTTPGRRWWRGCRTSCTCTRAGSTCRIRPAVA